MIGTAGDGDSADALLAEWVAAFEAGQDADLQDALPLLDEALRIRTEQELPVYERLGDKRSLLVTRAKLAMGLLQRDAEGDRTTAQGLLLQALQAAAAMQLPEMGQILGIMDQNGLMPEELGSRK